MFILNAILLRACAQIFCTHRDNLVLCLQCACVDPDNQGPAAPCGVPDYKGDGNCDDENNNKGCAYDGGDCCPKTVDGGIVKTQFCIEVCSK